MIANRRYGQNLRANFLAKIWGAALWLTLVPVYLSLLGPEAYGLVGLYLSLSLVTQLFDFGLSATANRELARADSVPDGFRRIRELVATIEGISWATGAAVGLILWLLIELTGPTWLRATSLDPGSITGALMLACLAISTQWPTIFYGGALSGLQRQARFAAITSVFATLRGGGAALILWQVSTSLEAFFLWNAICNLAQSTLLAGTFRKIRPAELDRSRPRLGSLHDVRGFATNMSMLSILAVCVTQLDKLLLPAWLPLDSYGFYVAAAALATAPQFIVAPILATLMPELSRLLAQGDSAAALPTYHRATRWLAVALAAPAALAITSGDAILLAWSANPRLAGEAGTVFAFLTAANCLNGIMCIPYAWQIARGWPQIPVRINMVSLTVMLPTLWFGTRQYGAEGAAFAWLAFNIVYVLFNLYYMSKVAPETTPLSGLVRDAIPPFGASLFVCLGAITVLTPASRPALALGLIATLALAGLVALLTARPCMNDLTKWLRRYMRVTE